MNSKSKRMALDSMKHFFPEKALSRAKIQRFAGPMPAPSLQQFPDVIDSRLLSKEQHGLLALLEKGSSLYFTGKAGTGKSQLLKHFVNRTREKGRRVSVIAPTGIAATNIGGQTIHSFSGISLGQTVKRKLAFKAVHNLTSTDVLVIDEVSMCRPELFRQLDELFREYQGNKDLPFGGIQVVLSGDFYQLPPIFSTEDLSRKRELEFVLQETGIQKSESKLSTQETRELMQQNTKFLFDSFTWKHLLHKGMLLSNLTQVYRQSEPELIKMLDYLRVGQCNEFVLDLLSSCRNREYNDDIMATKIFAYKAHVTRENERQLEKLGTSLVSFSSIDQVRISQPDKITANESILKKLTDPATFKEDFEKFSVDHVLNLKIGAQVILTRNSNVEKGLVNGSRGVVVDFCDQFDPILGRKTKLPIVKFLCSSNFEYQDFVVYYQRFSAQVHCGDVQLERIQIPLKLGWALTVHKSQGMSLDRVEINLPTAFSPGQAYVAFSRARSLQGLNITRFSQKAVFSSPRVKEFYEKLVQSPNFIQMLE